MSMGFDDQENPLGLSASASPGLATLPSQGAGIESLGFSPDPALVEVPPGAPGAAPLARPAAAPGGGSGLGLADFKAARSDDDKNYLMNLPTAEKIGLMLSSFGAGMQGQPNPIDVMLEQKRRREAEFRNELATTVKTITGGMAAVKSMPSGKARDALIEQITRASGSTGGEVKAALLAVDTEHEQAVRDSVSALENPAAQAILIKMSNGDPKVARELLKDETSLKLIHQAADRQTIPSLTAKMSVLSRVLEKMPQFKDANGKASFSMSDLREQNEQLPKEFQLTAAELGTADRNQVTLIPYGLKTDKTLQAEQEAGAKRKDTGTWGEPYMMNGAMVQKNDTTGEIRTAVTRAPKDPQEPRGQPVKVRDPDDPTKSIIINSVTGAKIGDAPDVKPSGKPLPTGTANKIEEAGTLVDATSRFNTTFKDEFGGDMIRVVGEARNTMGSKFGDETGRSAWWKDYDLHQSQVRNKLFGSALTASEIEAWNKSAINNGMDPKEIRKNLQLRADIEERGLSKLMRSAEAGGYNKAQIEELAGRPIPAERSKPVVPEQAAPKGDALVLDGYRFPNKDALEAYKKAKAGKR